MNHHLTPPLEPPFRLERRGHVSFVINLLLLHLAPLDFSKGDNRLLQRSLMVLDPLRSVKLSYVIVGLLAPLIWSLAVKRFLLLSRIRKSMLKGYWARLLGWYPVPRFVSVPERLGGDFSEPPLAGPVPTHLSLTWMRCYLPTDNRALG